MSRRAIGVGVAVLAAVAFVLIWARPSLGPATPTAGPTTARTVDELVADPPPRRDAADPSSGGARSKGTLAGVVVDVAGAPVAEAEVTLADLASGVLAATGTDARGGFAIALPAAPPLRLVVLHRDFLPQNLAVVALAVEPLRVVVQRPPRLRVRVVDAVTHAPIARAAVWLASVSGEQLPPVAEPPPDVRWQQRDDGVFPVTTRAVGAHMLAVCTDRGAPWQERLDLVADTVIDREAAIAIGVRARGVVRDADGQLVAAANVRLVLAAGAQVATTTGADGTFALSPLPPGEGMFVVEPEDGPELPRRDVRLLSATPEPFFELQLPQPASVSGVVSPWRAGNLAEVVFVHEQGPVRRLAVDPQSGLFAVADLSPGVHAVRVERTEPTWRNRVSRLFAESTTTRVELQPGGSVRVDVTDPEPALARVHGRLRGRDDFQGLVVRAFPEDRQLPDRLLGMLRASVQPDGAFEFDGLPPGSWRLQAMRGDDVLAWDVVALSAAAEASCELRLDRGR